MQREKVRRSQTIRGMGALLHAGTGALLVIQAACSSGEHPLGRVLDDAGGIAEPDPVEPTSCSESNDAATTSADLFFVVDTSASMAERVGGGSRWDAIIQAFGTFLEPSARNSGLGVGLQFFPGRPISLQRDCLEHCNDDGVCAASCGCVCRNGSCTCRLNGAICDAQTYSTPAVPINVLPDAASPMRSALTAQRIVDNSPTPTRPAYEGALQYGNQWASAHPNRRVSLVLITDGPANPATCLDNVLSASVALAGQAFRAASSVSTYVITVGTDPQPFEPLAVAGGTEHVYALGSSGTLPSELIQSLENIRKDALSCQYQVPAH